MQTRKHGWKMTSFAVVAMSIVLATLTGMLYARAPDASKKTINLTSQVITRNHPIARNDQKTVNTERWQSIVIRRGDTLSRVFGRLKIKQNDLADLTKRYREITVLRPGNKLYFQISPSHRLLALKYPVNTEKALILRRRGQTYIGNMSNNPTTTTLSFKSATINHTLPSAASHAGISKGMLSQLQSIFKDSINFSREIHHGDNFSFLYKEYYINGKKYRSGDIVAAEFVHDGKTYRAVRYQSADHHIGYFTPDGRGLGARFLNAPLNYKRISSPFNLHRWDPVLHEVRPHLGVDYAARSGTPIKSIGDGRVIFIGLENGFGRMVKIRYDRHQVALYAHMNHYAHLQMHQFVHKGETIGYVGTSGWATGPHLHFGFYVDGKPCNWLTMKMPTGQPIPYRDRKQFLAMSHQLLAQLQLYQDTQLAVNNAKIVRHPRS